MHIPISLLSIAASLFLLTAAGPLPVTDQVATTTTAGSDSTGSPLYPEEVSKVPLRPHLTLL